LAENPSANNNNEGAIPFVLENVDPMAIFTFCAATPEKMAEWEQAIIDFDNCRLELIPTPEE